MQDNQSGSELNLDETTEVFQRYRFCARLIWNLFFRPDPDLANWDSRDRFEAIKNLLFEALVLRKLPLRGEGTSFIVVPRAVTGVPIHIEQHREGDQNRYWDHPVSTLKPSNAVLEFLDYFDWDPVGWLDFKYVRVRIRAFPERPELAGREALLDSEYVQIGGLQAE